jgi:NTP pyrophosphatase (non-canonical NTP hydrolase)
MGHYDYDTYVCKCGKTTFECCLTSTRDYTRELPCCEETLPMKYEDSELYKYGLHEYHPTTTPEEKVTFESYQLEAQETAIYSGSLDIMYPALGLAGEVGETLNKIKKHYRDGTPLDKTDMTKELGDILWYLSALATDLDIDLEEVAMENLKKLKDRKDRGVIGGSGDYR